MSVTRGSLYEKPVTVRKILWFLIIVDLQIYYNLHQAHVKPLSLPLFPSPQSKNKKIKIVEDLEVWDPTLDGKAKGRILCRNLLRDHSHADFYVLHKHNSTGVTWECAFLA